jgi:Membrane bound O-acyl transferase family
LCLPISTTCNLQTQTMLHPLIAHLTACALLHLALLIPPRRLGHRHLAAVFLPLICSCHVYSWTRGFGALAGVHAPSAAELLLWRRPREEFLLLVPRRDGAGGGRDGATAVRKEPYPESLVPRFWWVLKLIASPRFIGWDTGSVVKGVQDSPSSSPSTSSIPPRPGEVRGPAQPRSSWLLRKCLSVIVCGIVIDAVNSFQAFDPYFLGQTGNIDAPLLHPSSHLLASSLFGRAHALRSLLSPRPLRIAVFGAQQYATFSVISSLAALVCVSLGGLGIVGDFWGEMQNWKPVMGSPLAICRRGLRGFWGGFWHQLFRHVRILRSEEAVEVSTNHKYRCLVIPGRKWQEH